jgi:glyoxylate carboligase
MAEGYGRAAAGNIGVCLVTSGPGGTDTVTALYSAWADSVPLLVIAGGAAAQRGLPGRRHRAGVCVADSESIVVGLSGNYDFQFLRGGLGLQGDRRA